MAYYRRRWRRRPRRYVRKWFRKRVRRFVNGSSRSVVRMKTAVTDTATISAGYGHGDAITYGDVASIGCFYDSNVGVCSALNSPLYRTYCALYDSVKCIGMRVSMSVTDPIGTVTVPSVQILTAWDRSRAHNSDAAHPADPNMTAEQMKNAATSNIATALNNNVAKMTRAIYASDLMERAQWHNASADKDSGADVYRDMTWRSTVSCPFFSPAFFSTFIVPTASSATTLHVSYSVVYYFAFRNPRYGGSSGSTSLALLGERMVTSDTGGDDAGAGASVAAAVRAGIPVTDAMIDGDVIQDESSHPGVTQYLASGGEVSSGSRTAALRAQKKAKDRVNPIVLRPPSKND